MPSSILRLSLVLVSITFINVAALLTAFYHPYNTISSSIHLNDNNYIYNNNKNKNGDRYALIRQKAVDFNYKSLVNLIHDSKAKQVHNNNVMGNSYGNVNRLLSRGHNSLTLKKFAKTRKLKLKLNKKSQNVHSLLSNVNLITELTRHKAFNLWREKNQLDFGPSNSEEYSKRFKQFCVNLELIKTHNSNLGTDTVEIGKAMIKKPSYHLGLTSFAHMDFAEFKSLYLNRYHLPRRTSQYHHENDGRFQLDHALMHNGRDQDLPALVDWRQQDGTFTAVKNENNTGQSWAYATAAVIETYYALNGGHLVQLSPQQLIDCVKANLLYQYPNTNSTLKSRVNPILKSSSSSTTSSNTPTTENDNQTISVLVNTINTASAIEKATDADKKMPRVDFHHVNHESDPTPNDAFKYLEKVGGLMSEAIYPTRNKSDFELNQNQQNHECMFNASKVRVRLGKHIVLPSGNEKQMTEIVATNGPIIATMSVSSDFHLYTKGIYAPKDCSRHIKDSVHAVVIVGYKQTKNMDKNNSKETDKNDDQDSYWIVRNSWGSEWGQDGYFLLKKGVSMCGIDLFPSYPVVPV